MIDAITLQAIGIIRSPFKNKEDMPLQPPGKRGAPGEIHIYPGFQEGLQDLEGFSHIYLLFYLHKAKAARLQVVPYLDNKPHGVFSTRSPARPNHIGLSLVEIDKIEKGVIYVKKIDTLDGTPVLDIKPVVPDFDFPTGPVRTGWLANLSMEVACKGADDRF